MSTSPLLRRAACALIASTLLIVTACQTAPAAPPTRAATLVPTLQASPVPTLQASPFANMVIITETPGPQPTFDGTPLAVNVQYTAGVGAAPPITLSLPQGWVTRDDVLLLNDVSSQYPLPFTVYTGPISGGQGTIVLLWGFPSLIPLSSDSGQAALSGGPVTTNSYADGLRLLRLAIVDPLCNVGTDIQREYPIGDRVGQGTQFASVDCPEEPDTRGWFVGLEEKTLSFVFYMYSEPMEISDRARGELQAILNTVRFNVPEPGTLPQVSTTPISFGVTIGDATATP
jgi:hypothetical protein